MKSISFLDLPEDMQVLIGQIAEDFAPNRKTADRNWDKLDRLKFPIVKIKISAFPDVAITGSAADDRGGAIHARAMAGLSLPPIVVGGKSWYDGRHRVWIARRTGKKSIDAIDLRDAGLELIDDPYMGPLAR